MDDERNQGAQDPQEPELPAPPDESLATPQPTADEPPPTADEPGPDADGGEEPEPDEPAEPEPDVWRPRRPRILPPWEGIEVLERQWEDTRPLAERQEPLTGLAHTTETDPRGWEHIEALTGASPGALAKASALWLEAQLAADALAIGRTLRPRVDLLPAGCRWHVVRTIADVIVALDGPGHRTPGAALRAAALRYHAELLRDLERERLPGSITDDEAEPAREGADAEPSDDASREDDVSPGGPAGGPDAPGAD